MQLIGTNIFLGDFRKSGSVHAAAGSVNLLRCQRDGCHLGPLATFASVIDFADVGGV